MDPELFKHMTSNASSEDLVRVEPGGFDFSSLLMHIGWCACVGVIKYGATKLVSKIKKDDRPPLCIKNLTTRSINHIKIIDDSSTLLFNEGVNILPNSTSIIKVQQWPSGASYVTVWFEHQMTKTQKTDIISAANGANYVIKQQDNMLLTNEFLIEKCS